MKRAQYGRDAWLVVVFLNKQIEINCEFLSVRKDHSFVKLATSLYIPLSPCPLIYTVATCPPGTVSFTSQAEARVLSSRGSLEGDDRLAAQCPA